MDLVPSYASLLVIYDALSTDHLSVSHRIHEAAGSLEATTASVGREVVLPVYYHPEAGEDLESLADRAGISMDEVIALHSGSEYRVYAIGFAPGFAYLGEVEQGTVEKR